jgi:hypothetical protein
MYSGFQDRDDAKDLSFSGINHFFTKPLKIDEIAEVVRNILDKKS